MGSMMNTAFVRLIAGAGLLCLAALAAAEDSPWILVDTSERTLYVMAADNVLDTYPAISLGRRGAAETRRTGDGITPLGSFRIAWIKLSSRFYRFFGLDYPNEEHVERALQRKLIDFDIYYQIRQALSLGQVPPQDTPLGGYIGIHGIGAGDERVHQISNWTEGCVALTNPQIDQLAQWINVGTQVVIR